MLDTGTLSFNRTAKSLLRVVYLLRNSLTVHYRYTVGKA